MRNMPTILVCAGGIAMFANPTPTTAATAFLCTDPARNLQIPNLHRPSSGPQSGSTQVDGQSITFSFRS